MMRMSKRLKVECVCGGRQMEYSEERFRGLENLSTDRERRGIRSVQSTACNDYWRGQTHAGNKQVSRMTPRCYPGQLGAYQE